MMVEEEEEDDAREKAIHLLMERAGGSDLFPELAIEAGRLLERRRYRQDMEKVERAYDLLGGMWSWRDSSLDDSSNSGLWTIQAGRVLREVVGRPAKEPK